MSGHAVVQRRREIDVRLQPLEKLVVAEVHERRVVLEQHHGVARIRDVDLRHAPQQRRAPADRGQQPVGQVGAALVDGRATLDRAER